MSKRSKFGLTAVTLLIFVSVVSYFHEDRTAFDAAIDASDDLFIGPAHPATRYREWGQANRPTVVLIHSFNGFIESWDANAKTIAAAGYRVIAYDLVGRGLSSRPSIDLTLDVFRQQLETVIDRTAAGRPVLVGSSFGSVIAADYAIHHPENVAGVIMIGPAGWPTGEKNQLINVPIIADAIFHLAGKRLLQNKVEEYFIDPEQYADVISQWESFARYPGLTRSALSTLRHSPVLDNTSGWLQFAELGLPTLILWGRADRSFPYSLSENAKAAIPHAEIVGIDDAAHWVNIEQAAVVNEHIIEFLK